MCGPPVRRVDHEIMTGDAPPWAGLPKGGLQKVRGPLSIKVARKPGKQKNHKDSRTLVAPQMLRGTFCARRRFSSQPAHHIGLHKGDGLKHDSADNR